MLSMAVLAERQFLSNGGKEVKLTLFDGVERSKTDAPGLSLLFPAYLTAFKPLKLQISSCQDQEESRLTPSKILWK